MNAKGRAVRAQLLTCAFLLGLLAWTGSWAQENSIAENTATGIRVGTARFSAIGDDPDPVPWNRIHMNMDLSQRFVVDAIVAFTCHPGPAWHGLPCADGRLWLGRSVAAGERVLIRLDAGGRREPVRRAPIEKR